MRFVKRRFFITLLLLVCFSVVGVWLFSSHVIASPDQYVKSDPLSQTAPWIVQPPEFRNKLLHYTQLQTQQLKDSASAPEKERTTLADIWMKLNQLGELEQFYGLYTSADGKTFYQEIYEDRQTSTTVFGKKDPFMQQMPLGCPIQSPQTPSALKTPRILFIDMMKLQQATFQMKRTAPAPSQNLSPSFITQKQSLPSPQKVYAATGAVQIWEKTEKLNGGEAERNVTEEIDQHHRLLVDYAVTRTASGAMSSMKTVFGTVEVYETEKGTSSVFPTHAQLLTKGCDR
ncbi:hypothetical protein EI42_05647 [Thermosporothrix hazakensis]|jgi:hypothetical protein|uniref:Uncharacterized protein n=1 Tax=Thermosporothrix hazakensis TaxID=644383 RepID=A0A326TVM0_THEHA|nr:hypothetical protein [Thermosporothrix hazakensis]PZW21111.1 hypothetical protein EI42_05647 [Thermosporothrix hazakensis]